MMNKSRFAASVLVVTFLIGFIACKKDPIPVPPPPTEFNRTAMLENIGNNIIVPGYESLKNTVSLMDAATVKFIATPDLQNLTDLQTAYKNACIAWQNVSIFEFGPAEQLLLRVNVNTFPTDTTQIASNISSGTYDLTTVSNIDAKGFPAMDFLLFGVAPDNNAIVNKYTSDANAANRKAYLQNINNELKANVNSVYTSWSASGGNYINTFINNTGTDVGSSLGMLVNQLNYDFESLKNYKIGIPLGKKTLGTPLPEKVEGLYGKNSVQLAVENLKAIENVYLGRSKQGVDGPGLDDNLIYLSAEYNGGLLSDAIKTQLSSGLSKLQSIPDPLSQTIINNPSVVDAAYIELQKQVVLFKTDMASALGVLITYQDNDGD